MIHEPLFLYGFAFGMPVGGAVVLIIVILGTWWRNR